MITIETLAKAFLTFGKMSPKKLQKLCYYAYAWHITLTGEKLVNTTFEAWVHGPVERTLYFSYKDYGYFDIPQYEKEISDIIDNENIVELINQVYRIYGDLDGNSLENLTHQEGPWINARNGLNPWEASSSPISDQDIINFYSRELVE